ncbi:MAG TPA: hypothetical protein VD903_19790 [Pseudonocardia sp.]|nr:hypothetical protein [Pseudonocardia sp.]
MSPMGNEDPDADVAEQLQAAEPGEDGPDENGEERAGDPGGLPSEADPADVAEQRAVVPENDDYDR